ncbi:hypothetical protein ON010_g7565 [Phytophthora cinnamomi]|nr:hypothetical protein ON010_g7565 [Phytophthora cinnamomi]
MWQLQPPDLTTSLKFTIFWRRENPRAFSLALTFELAEKKTSRGVSMIPPAPNKRTSSEAGLSPCAASSKKQSKSPRADKSFTPSPSQSDPSPAAGAVGIHPATRVSVPSCAQMEERPARGPIHAGDNDGESSEDDSLYAPTVAS